MQLHQRLSRIYALRGLHHSGRDVLLCLAFHADTRDRCYPSLRTIASETSLAVRTVRRSVNNLVKAGLVALAKGHARRSNRYVLILPVASSYVVPVRTQRSPSAHRTVHEQHYETPLAFNARTEPISPGFKLRLLKGGHDAN